MPSPTVQGTPSTIVFGAASLLTAGLAAARVISATYDETTKLVPMLDSNGIPTGRFNVPQEIKVQVKIEMDSGDVPAGVSSSANYTFGGVAFYLDKPAKKTYSRGEIAGYDIELTAFPS